MQDTRSRNQYFSDFRAYAGGVAWGLNRVDLEEITKAQELLRLTSIRGGRVFVCGNGGSAAIADHLTCDFVKGTHTEKTHGIQVQSLVGSPALLTAIANDISYDKIFGFQMELYKITPKDCAILISSSGSSKNIIDALTTAHAYGADVIGLSGFEGGMLKKFCNISLHVPCFNYGVVEDAHQSIMHYLAQKHYLDTNG